MTSHNASPNNASPGRALRGACGGGAILGLTLFGSVAARADLIQDQFIDLGGTGIGAVSTLLTLQNASTETASVGRTLVSPGADVITGDAKTGANQTQTFTFAQLGVASASDLRLIVNLNENDDAATLDNLTLNVFDASGNTVFSGGTVGALELTGAGAGTGNSGFTFKLDPAQVLLLQSAFAPGLRVGVSASLSGTSGGNETIFATSVGGTTPQAIPEPGSIALLAAALPLTGMIGMAGRINGAMRRRRSLSNGKA